MADPSDEDDGFSDWEDDEPDDLPEDTFWNPPTPEAPEIEITDEAEEEAAKRYDDEPGIHSDAFRERYGWTGDESSGREDWVDPDSLFDQGDEEDEE